MRECWIATCYRAPVGESRFCVTHGWNQTGADHVPLVKQAESKTYRKRVWTRAAILAAIDLWIVSHGRAPTQDEWTLAADDHPTVRTVRIHFGTWSAALAAAGIVRGPGRPCEEAA